VSTITAGVSHPDAAFPRHLRPSASQAPQNSPPRPLKVGVLVDLAFTPGAGGHVKCWQRLAEAAVAYPEQLDLTVHFSGRRARRIALSPTVRYELLPPVLSTARLVRNVPDDTDLAPWHSRLALALADYDVIHTTDAFFCYARTAARFARRHGTPIVSSIHTNTPEYARITMGKLLERWLGTGLAYRVAKDCLGVPDRVRGFFEHRLARHLASVTSAVGGFANAPDLAHGHTHSGISLRRGLDREMFAPWRRDRACFERRYALPAGRFIVMYAGKLNAGKNVPLLVPIAQAAREAGVPVQLFCAGQGAERPVLEAALGAAVRCAGTLTQDELARAYASADLFAFPSEIDEFGNAALEALASGLPTLIARGSGIAAAMEDCPGMRVLPGDDPRLWAAAIIELSANQGRRDAMGHAARAYVETRVPSWGEVLEQDLLPVWLAAGGARR
jgi:glycosyltransferase involved in cell wall biosynthesis